MANEYLVVCQQVVGCADRGFDIIYGWDGDRFSARQNAIKAGLKLRGSDDFNVAVVDGDNLVSFDWMDSPVGEDAETLREIAEALGLRV